MTKYAITDTFYKRSGKAGSTVVSMNDVLTRVQKDTKIKPEGYRISEITNINSEDPSQFTKGKEITEFAYKEIKENDQVVDFVPAKVSEEDAIIIKSPFTTDEAVMFVLAYGETNGTRKEIHNARTVVRSNLGSNDVPYIVAIGAPIEKSLTNPKLREKITDDNGNLLPFYKEKFGKKRASRKGEAVKEKKAKLVGALATRVGSK